ncbi:hypothetical protein EV201_3002 [Ancylomarina subtilis]|uniref:Uncharacterized protein n=1 Tax=Ancylomarina subtilis TaxID=1639035 RepID=A0A4V2FRU7_9BACT|nr:hypothetical protein [Ancylomarina subtilis]RZT91789.1 hypothetical protein EV201_3002 [Ancylomarina subtilis]
MEKVKHNIKRIVYLCVGVIGLLILNNILFTHSQILFDGSVIIHAHPYNKTSNPPQNHHHDKDELLILANIALLFFTAAVIYHFDKTLINSDKNEFQQIKYITILFLRKLGRAPPKDQPQLCHSLFR